MSHTMIPKATIEDFWLKQDELNDFTIADLAWITHEAEDIEDDFTMIAIQNHLLHRPDKDTFNTEYRRLWPIYQQMHQDDIRL